MHPECAVVIVSDLGEDNNGTTVTNCAAQVATDIVKKFKLDPRSLLLPGITTSSLVEKVKDSNERLWYIQNTLDHHWSRKVMHPY